MQNRSAGRKGKAVTGTPCFYPVHQIVFMDAQAALHKTTQIGGQNDQYQRQQKWPRPVQAEMRGQRKKQQKAQAAEGGHYAAQFQNIQPEQFKNNAERERQSPIGGVKARNQREAYGPVQQADDT